MGLELYDYQMKAVNQMKNGCILCGDVGSGKSRTALMILIWFNIGRKIIKYVLNLIIKRIIQKIFRIRRIRIYDYQ